MELLSLRQAARELHIAERTLREAVHMGELEVYQLGERTKRVDRRVLWRWVKTKKFKPWRSSR